MQEVRQEKDPLRLRKPIVRPVFSVRVRRPTPDFTLVGCLEVKVGVRVLAVVARELAYAEIGAGSENLTRIGDGWRGRDHGGVRDHFGVALVPRAWWVATSGVSDESRVKRTKAAAVVVLVFILSPVSRGRRSKSCST